jgi:hypothetical protein
MTSTHTHTHQSVSIHGRTFVLQGAPGAYAVVNPRTGDTLARAFSRFLALANAARVVRSAA